LAASIIRGRSRSGVEICSSNVMPGSTGTGLSMPHLGYLIEAVHSFLVTVSRQVSVVLLLKSLEP
jgi:hypothetical protein